MDGAASFAVLCAWVPLWSQVEVLVLDEVDQLLDGGFQKDLERIVACLSPHVRA